MVKAVSEAADYIESLVTLEICYLMAHAGGYDAGRALVRCCKMMRKRLRGKKARQLCKVVAASPSPENAVRYMRKLLDEAISS